MRADFVKNVKYLKFMTVNHEILEIYAEYATYGICKKTKAGRRRGPALLIHSLIADTMPHPPHPHLHLAGKYRIYLHVRACHVRERNEIAWAGLLVFPVVYYFTSDKIKNECHSNPTHINVTPLYTTPTIMDLTSRTASTPRKISTV